MVYWEIVNLFVHSEQFGFDSGWVCQYHFHKRRGIQFRRRASSPFVFLSAGAQRTSHLRLETGVVTLPLENTIRVTEDAAELAALSDRRLELVLANGGHPDTAAALGIDRPTDRGEQKVRYLAELNRLKAILRGESADDEG